MSNYISHDFRRGEYLEEPKWLSWLQVQEQAVYTLDPETETEEELWYRSVAKNGITEEVYAFADAHRTRNALKSDHDYYSYGSIDLAVEPTSGHDWAESETIRPDGTTRHEFKQDWNSLADRPSEDFMLGLPGLRAIENGTQDRYLKWNKLCSKCGIYTPKAMATCQNCEN